ncbi:MAG: hypothetical protein HC831_14540, partial [Chloroflexia bacterium]|nr:hypothetical protein [Chloroflexia bacterium]
ANSISKLNIELIQEAGRKKTIIRDDRRLLSIKKTTSFLSRDTTFGTYLFIGY